MPTEAKQTKVKQQQKSHPMLRLDVATLPDFLAAAAELTAAAGEGRPPLSTAQRRDLAKPLVGGTEVVAEVAALAREVGIEEVGGLSVATMLASLERARVLVQASRRVEALSLTLRDETLRAKGEYWRPLLALYGVLQRYAATDVGVAARLAPVQVYFHKKKARRKAPPAAAAPDTKAEAKPDTKEVTQP